MAPLPWLFASGLPAIQGTDEQPENTFPNTGVITLQALPARRQDKPLKVYVFSWDTCQISPYSEYSKAFNKLKCYYDKGKYIPWVLTTHNREWRSEHDR